MTPNQTPVCADKCEHLQLSSLKNPILCPFNKGRHMWHFMDGCCNFWIYDPSKIFMHLWYIRYSPTRNIIKTTEERSRAGQYGLKWHYTHCIAWYFSSKALGKCLNWAIKRNIIIHSNKYLDFYCWYFDTMLPHLDFLLKITSTVI